MNKKDITSAFKNVDILSDIDFIVQFLDAANQKTAVKDCKRHMEEQMRIRPGDHLLDIGCGTGDNVRRLAELTGSNGKAIGIDISQKLVEIDR